MTIPIKALKQTAALAKSLAKTGAISTTIDGIARYSGGPELKHISLEYLLSRNVLPLGCIIHIFGPEGCGKTTLALDLLNRYFIREGGNGDAIDTEGKISPPLYRAIIDPGAEQEKRFIVHRAMTQEATQGVVNALVKHINSVTFGKNHDEFPHLEGIIIDSFRVASEQTQDKITAEGHATKQFALEANLWRPFLATTSAKMLYAPISLILVNHMTEKEATYGKVKDHGGGLALKFYETYSILLTKMNSHRTKTESYSDLTLQTYKNSNGPDRQKICPRIVYKSASEDGTPNTYVDWTIADARLLSGPDIPREALKRAGVCNVKESTKAGLYSDDVLGVSCVPIEGILEKIYSDPARIGRLRQELSIYTAKTLDELWEDGWFFDARSIVESDEE